MSNTFSNPRYGYMYLFVVKVSIKITIKGNIHVHDLIESKFSKIQCWN